MAANSLRDTELSGGDLKPVVVAMDTHKRDVRWRAAHLWAHIREEAPPSGFWEQSTGTRTSGCAMERSVR